MKKENEFLWTDVHTMDCKRIIEALCNDSKLPRYYKPELDLYLETDVSGVATGMALLQCSENLRESVYPIAYGSKALTDAEAHYANNKRELLGRS